VTKAPDFDEVVAGEVSTGEVSTSSTRGESEPTGSRLDDWWLRRSPRTRTIVRWAAPAAVIAVAAVTRLWNLGHPDSLVFDETYYVKDGWSLWNLGYESQWPAESDPRFAAGETDIYTGAASYVVHPPLGKWVIGAGMALLGPDNPVGWRISVAIVGILLVVLTMLIAKRLTGSQLLATIAGFLFAIEGNAIVMSRVSLLDGILALFALLGVGAVLLDREWSRVRLAAWIGNRRAAGRDVHWGPALWNRPWLIAAAVAFGLASAVKWSGLYFLAGFAVYTLVSDALARRRAGLLFWGTGTIVKQGPVTFLLMVPIALAAYLVTWTGWFLSDDGYDRHWLEGDPATRAWSGALAWVPHALQNLWHFASEVYAYHVGENRPHSYQANPLSWLLMIRPTSMFYQGAEQGQDGCTAASCGSEIIGLANPFIWWAATAAAVYLVYRLIRYREWTAGFVLMGLAAGYLPWLLYLNRTVFQFYSIAFEPYLILALTLAIGIIIGSPGDPRWRRTGSLRLVAVCFAVFIAASIFFWPLWTGMQLDFNYLRIHWWLPTWN
jgi:dolichyl-phosphate-mannose--protein O-mannosyl transferase